jgi:hypothetical protein
MPASVNRLVYEFLAEAAKTAQWKSMPGLRRWHHILAFLRVVQHAAGMEDDGADTARARISTLVGDEPDVLAGRVNRRSARRSQWPSWCGRCADSSSDSPTRPVVVLFDDVR